MSKVHIVSGYYEYEGSRPLVAFDTKKGAEAFKAACEAHDAIKPEFPEDSAAFDAWEKKDARWRKRHPAGKDNTLFDGYVVDAMAIRRAATPIAPDARKD